MPTKQTPTAPRPARKRKNPRRASSRASQADAVPTVEPSAVRLDAPLVVAPLGGTMLMGGKVPASIGGAGFDLVDLATYMPRVVFHPDETGKALAAAVNAWDGDVLEYSEVLAMAPGRGASVKLSEFLSKELSRLRATCPRLHEAIELAKAYRAEYLSGLIERDEPIAYAFLAEALSLFANKLVVMSVGTDRIGGRVVTAERRASFFRDHVVVTYEVTMWYGGSLRLATGDFSISATALPRTMAQYGIREPNASEMNEMSRRGRRAIEMTLNSAFVDLVGHMESRDLYRWVPVPSTGRAVVDPTGLQANDPRSYQDMVDMYEIKGGNEAAISPSSISDADAFCMSPHLAVFSMSAKRWGRVHVDRVRDITFREDAFDRVVMPAHQRKMIYSLVKNTDPSVSSDFIDGKGGGCVLLLHGKPGRGKTLTAEAIAESLRRPLYVVTVGELGVDPATLDKQLQKVLSTAARWNAVLLIDEADVFLEQRHTGDVNRNALVSSFLRLLEYYNGVLILTTNRVKDIDEAFYSRISLAFHYDEFTSDAREQVVRNLLALNGLHFHDADVARVAQTDSNGRQLKNAIRQAGYLAKEDGRAPTADDVLLILANLNAFQAEMDARRLPPVLGGMPMSRGGDAE